MEKYGTPDQLVKIGRTTIVHGGKLSDCCRDALLRGGEDIEECPSCGTPVKRIVVDGGD